MQAVADDALDPELIAYFRARYGALDAEEITELVARRDTLSDEAAAALDHVTSTRGIQVMKTAAAVIPPPETTLEQQVTQARELWASGISMTGRWLCMAAFVGLAPFPAKLVPHFGSNPAPALMSSLLVGAVTAGMGYAGYRLGRFCTREICSNGDKLIAQRRSSLRLFAAAVIPVYLIIYALLSAMFSR